MNGVNNNNKNMLGKNMYFNTFSNSAEPKNSKNNFMKPEMFSFSDG
jgi:hypothetical protein